MVKCKVAETVLLKRSKYRGNNTQYTDCKSRLIETKYKTVKKSVTHQGLLCTVTGEECRVDIPVGKQAVKTDQLRRRKTQGNQRSAAAYHDDSAELSVRNHLAQKNRNFLEQLLSKTCHGHKLTGSNFNNGIQ